MASGVGGGMFGKTTQKCRACEKTVYLVDQLTVDNRVYHRACFRCHHCRGTLKGVLYCKPHFDQLFKMTGSLDKSFEDATRAGKADRSIANEGYSTSKISRAFLGTQEKCIACKKTVYPIEKIAVDGNSYHKPCFRCTHGGCVISPSNYIAHEGRLFCRYHHSQLIMQKGNFSQLSGKHELSKESTESPTSGNVKLAENPLVVGAKQLTENSTPEPVEKIVMNSVSE